MRSHPRPSLRNEQISRVLQVLRELDRLDGADVYELAERFGTSVRTIRRDLDALRDAGLPLAESDGEGPRKRWRLAWREQKTRLSDLVDAGHYLALRVAMGRGGPAKRASALFASLEDLADKLEAALGPREREKLRAIERCFLSHEKFAYARSGPDVFWPLVGAIGEGLLCRVVYRAPRPRPQDKEFEVLPLRLFAHDGAAYVLCAVPHHGNSVITLNLQRLQRLEVTARRGTPPADFDPDRWESSAFGIVGGGPPTTYVLRFDAQAAPYIRERIWHPTQTLEERADGSVLLRFTCGESYEVSAWVASWGASVEALEPAALREELEVLGRRLLGMYAPRRAHAPAGA